MKWAREEKNQQQQPNEFDGINSVQHSNVHRNVALTLQNTETKREREKLVKLEELSPCKSDGLSVYATLVRILEVR